MHISRLLFLVLAIVITPPGWGDDAAAEAKVMFLKEVQKQVDEARKVFARASYCIAYSVREGESLRGVLDPKKGVNDELLRSKAIGKKRLAAETARRVVGAALDRKARHPVRECYEPHHVFVFYSAENEPAAAVEVCLTCKRIRVAPGEVNTLDLYGDHETADLNTLAKVLDEAGLPLTPFKSWQEYSGRK